MRALLKEMVELVEALNLVEHVGPKLEDWLRRTKVFLK